MRIFGWSSKKEKRATSSSNVLDSLFGFNRYSLSGSLVTPQTALTYTAVYAAVRILAESVASLPLFIYKRLPNGGKERAKKHPLFFLLHDEPNIQQDSFQFREMMMGHLLLRGNAYAKIIINGKGDIKSLVPLNPDKMRVTVNEKGNIVYVYQAQKGEEKYLQDEIFHVKGLSSDGLVGLSPIDLARNSIGLGMDAEGYGATFFSNNASPGGILSHPGKIGDAGAELIKKSWQEKFSGKANQHKVAVLEEGMKWEAIGLKNTDSQFLETRKFQVTEIARIFRVPPHMIGDLDKATFSNIEQQSLEFVIFSLRPWLVRWESAIKRALFLDEEKEDYFAEFLVDGLLRGDIGSRYSAYAVGRQNGWLSVDEIREFENLNPLPDDTGKIYLEPLNMRPVGEEVEEPIQEPQNPIKEPTKEPEPDKRAVDEAIKQVINENLGRLVRKEAKFYQNLAKKPQENAQKEALLEFKTKISEEISEGCKSICGLFWHIKVKGKLDFDRSFNFFPRDFLKYWDESIQKSGDLTPEKRTEQLTNKFFDMLSEQLEAYEQTRN